MNIIKRLSSNNHPRPRQMDGSYNVDKIIVHAMAEWIELGDNDQQAWEYLNTIGLSAHYFVTPTGVIIQQVEEDRVAYHAKGHNETSIGVEFLVPGVHTYSTFLEAIDKPWSLSEQFEAGKKLIAGIRTRLGGVEIFGHNEVSPGRKKDPGEFPIEELR